MQSLIHNSHSAIGQLSDMTGESSGVRSTALRAHHGTGVKTTGYRIRTFYNQKSIRRINLRKSGI